MRLYQKFRDISRALRALICRLCPARHSVTYLPPPRQPTLDSDELWREEQTDPETPISKRAQK